MRLNLHIIGADLGVLPALISKNASDKLAIVSPRVYSDECDEVFDDVLYVMDSSAYSVSPHKSRLRYVAFTEEPGGVAVDKRCQFIVADGHGSPEALLARLLSLFDWYARMEGRIASCASSGTAVDELLDLGHELLGTPLALFDGNMSCIHIAGREHVRENDPVWRDIITEGHATIDLAPQLRRDREVMGLVNTSRRAFVYKFPRLGLPCLHRNIFVEDMLVGCLCSTECQEPLTRRTTSLADFLAPYLSSVLSRRLLVPTSSPSFYQLVESCLEGEAPDEVFLSYAMAAFGWSETDWLVTYVCTQGESSGSANLALECRTIEREIPHCHAVGHEGNILVVQNASLSGTRTEVADRLRAVAERLGLSCACSEPFQGLSHLSAGYSHAMRALDVGGRRGGGTWFDYRELALEILFDSAGKDISPLELCMPEVLELHRGDLENQTQYVLTLYCYLACERSLKACANALYIHRNTFVYRLGRLREMLGEGVLEDPDKTLRLMLSCWIVLYLNDGTTPRIGVRHVLP